MPEKIIVIGGGLAGCEAALQIAESGFSADLYEMRPDRMTPAHTTGNLAELVCSNSFRSNNPANAAGLLKEELRRAGSLVFPMAEKCAVPAGDALAVDRELFSSGITSIISGHQRISLIRKEITELPESVPVIVASGPLTSEALSTYIGRLTGESDLYFYDAIAPIIDGDSLDMAVVFAQSRYGKGEGNDYMNCPFSEKEYSHFVEALLDANRVPLREFEEEKHFQGCMPVEAICDTGLLALAHGPMKPVGLTDPRTGERPFAVVQLRRENLEGTAWNMVGFQTKLRYPEQKRVFRMIPGLEKAQFLRLGSMHRNTFINGPALLDDTLRLKNRENIMFAGQITGVEGYIESVACGWLAARFCISRLRGIEPVPPPSDSALGALLRHVTLPPRGGYQPCNVNYGLFPPVRARGGRKERRKAYSARALESLDRWLTSEKSND